MNTTITCPFSCRERKPAPCRRAVVIRVVILTTTLACLDPCSAQTTEPVSSDAVTEPKLKMFRDPDLRMPDPIRQLPDTYLDLWIEALSGPEQGLKREMAMNITRAHAEGYADCSRAIEALITVLNDDAAPRPVLVEVARALITLDAREHSEQLKAVLQKGAGAQYERVVELALAQWHDAEMQTIWQKRLKAGSVPGYRRILALESLTMLPRSLTADQRLHEDIQQLMITGRDTGIRLQAAKTLGQLKREGLENVARDYLTTTDTSSGMQQLAGFYLLNYHTSDSSRTMLLQVARTSLTQRRLSPVVRAIWRHLLDQKVSDLASLAPQAITNVDPELRRASIETLIRFPSDEGIALLGLALDDHHPEVRRTARQGLVQLAADSSWSDQVRLAGSIAIARSSWREQEQAVMLLALLNQTDASNRMLKLMESSRPEVAVAAAWGLRRLNVAETMPPLLEYAEKLDRQIEDGQLLQLHEPAVLAHVFEALGLARYEPAIPLLKRWIPKKFPRVSLDAARAAAVWSLGWLHEESRDLALARLLTARVVDVFSLEPESTAVRHTAAVAVGRIGAPDVASQLKPLGEMAQTPTDLAAAWAFTRLTGELIAPVTAPVESGNQWKLTPVGSRSKPTSIEAKVR